jgi:hypothetical protein
MGGGLACIHFDVHLVWAPVCTGVAPVWAPVWHRWEPVVHRVIVVAAEADCTHAWVPGWTSAGVRLGVTRTHRQLGTRPDARQSGAVSL